MADSLRCPWAERGDLDRLYHDEEWGRPLHDERRLFEMLILEGMQAGLSWSIVLKKRDRMREVFDGFDPAIIAKYDGAKIEALMGDAGIIRNRRKIEAAVTNAQAYFRLCGEHGSLDAFLWEYVGGVPIINHWAEFVDVPATTPLSDKISGDLKKLGMKFVGSTIVYAYMQAIGMVDDHLITCPAHTENRL